MRPLADHLTSGGHVCHLPSLSPNDGRTGLDALAAQLASYIDEFLPADEKFCVVAFSMGAIVSRFYLQELGGHARAAAYFSISGPHSGTWLAYFYPTKGARQMKPGSDFLARLDAGSDKLKRIPKACYWTPFDLMILPATSSCWAACEIVCIPALAHPLMLVSRKLMRDLSERIQQTLKTSAFSTEWSNKVLLENPEKI